MFEDLYQELAGAAFLTERTKIIPELSRLLKEAMQQKGRVGVAFSGGVDSSIMALLTKQRALYSVGMEGSSDVGWARKIAERMNWQATEKVLSVREAEGIIHNVVAILSKNNVDLTVVNVGVGAVVYAVLDIAKQDKVKVVYEGLGAEEIFGGYKRHVDYGANYEKAHIHQRLWEGLFGLEERDIARDSAIAKKFKIELVAPFLHPPLVAYAMRIDPSLKINDKQKKIVLRETAIRLGLPEEFALRKKVAAQYGSNVDRVMLRLAKKNGFKHKKDYIESLR